MSNSFVFDKIENDIINLDQNTVIRETGVDAARVKERVMKEIRGGKKARILPLRKVFSVIAIAAAIIAFASLSAAGATGAFRPLFGMLYAGEPANGVYSGADLTITSDTLDIEFIGITGEETSVMAVYDITNKDGSNFVDNYDPDGDYRFLSAQPYVNISENVYKKYKFDIFGGGQGCGSGVRYELLDEKTIRAYAAYHDSLGYIKGERLTVSDDVTKVTRIDEVLYRYTVGVDKGINAFMEENADFIDQKKASFTENQNFVVLDDDSSVLLAVGTETTIPFVYDLGVTLNYRTVEKDFKNAVETEFSALDTDWKVTGLKGDCFGIKLKASTDNCGIYAGFDMENSANWSPETEHDFMNVPTDITLDITLKDGTKLVAESGNVQSSGDSGNHADYEWQCTYFVDPSRNKPYALDPNEIASVKCNGTELIN